MTADHLGTMIAKGAYYPPGPGYGFGLGVAVRLAAGEAAFAGSVGDWFWSGVGGTYFWVDPVAGFFALLMMQTSAAAQRQHYRTLTRAVVYAALDAPSAEMVGLLPLRMSLHGRKKQVRFGERPLQKRTGSYRPMSAVPTAVGAS